MDCNILVRFKPSCSCCKGENKLLECHSNYNDYKDYLCLVVLNNVVSKHVLTAESKLLYLFDSGQGSVKVLHTLCHINSCPKLS